eukprot:16449273-Heterocapsa_arctica.AAC.1
MELMEIANYLENSLIKRATEDEEEELEEHVEPTEKKDTTEEIKEMTKTITSCLDKFQTMEMKMEEMIGIQDETRMLMKEGFKEQERSFDSEHIHNSKNHKKLEDDIKRLAKEGKMKSEEMEQGEEEEPEEDVSDDDEEHLLGAQRRDMNRQQKADVI